MTVQKLRDFNFLCGLAPGLLDGLFIGRFEEKRESFNLFAAKFESGAMRFWGENHFGAGALSKQGFLPCPSIIRNSKRRTQNASKSPKKPLLRQKGNNNTTGKVIQRLFNIDCRHI